MFDTRSRTKTSSRLFESAATRLSALLGLLYAITAVAVYGLFRLATPQAPSFVAAVIMILSPLQLRYLPQLRDYAKAPFLLTLVLILGLLVTRRFTRRRLFVLAVSYGAVAGIGTRRLSASISSAASPRRHGTEAGGV